MSRLLDDTAVTALAEALKPFVFAEPNIDIRIVGTEVTLVVSAVLRPKRRAESDELAHASARRSLYDSAEELISAVEADGFRHLDHPDIRITGVVQHCPDGSQRLIAQGEIELELLPPRR